MAAHYDLGVVALSILIAILASYTALDLVTSIYVVQGRSRAIWLLAGSTAMGAGIWSMHFVGMLAFHLPNIRIEYDVRLVVLSVLIAIVASLVALLTLTRAAVATATFGIAGLAMGVAIAGMHYTEMAALRVPADVHWNGWLVTASIIIAVAASFVALNLALRVRAATDSWARWLKLGGAAVMGLAIAGMHYTGMAAAQFVPVANSTLHAGEGLVATTGLGVAVVGGTVLILLIAIGGSFVTRQLSRRNELTARLRQSEEYYRALIETASDLIFVVDVTGKRTFASPSYERVLGYRPETLLGRSALEFVHPDDLPTAQRAMAALVDAPNDYSRAEVRVQHADGSWRTFNVIGHNLLDNPAVRGIVMTATDETERRRMELQFRESQKMEAIGRLAGGVAHDFNNLLTVILGNLQMLISEAHSDDELRSGLAEIQGAAQRAAALTRQLLAFSRRQMLQPHTIDLNDVVRGMQSMLARLLGEDIVIESTLHDELWCVRADPGHVEQALMNLAVNARDAMPNGGLLHFASQNITDPDIATPSPDLIPPGDYVCITVRDAGTGIDNATMSRMFEPFFTTKEVGKGTGLGLATVYGIMKQSGGHVCVHSDIGYGSAFQLYFPRVPDAARHPLTPVADLPRMGSETVLLLEDEAGVRSLTKRVLERAGYHVLDSDNAAQTIESAQHFEGPIHLLLTDVVLPDLNGREVADRVGLLRPGIRTLFMSGYTEDAMILRGVLARDVNFLQKPFTPNGLLDCVRKVLSK